jgi:RHS repeat-associated protein
MITCRLGKRFRPTGRNSQWGLTPDVEQKFTGQIRDNETGMDYFNARYLTGALGRFNSSDPLNLGADATDPQTWNGYAYVRNNPLALVDPMGLCHIGADNVAYDDEPGNGGGGSVTVTASPPPDVMPIFVSLPSLLSDTQQPAPTAPPPAVTEAGAGGAPSENVGIPSKLAACAASKASSLADLLGLPKDNFWAQAFLGNDFATATNLLVGKDRLKNGLEALISNPTPVNAASVVLWALGKKVVATGGLVVKETPGGTPYAVTRFLPLAATLGGKVALKSLLVFYFYSRRRSYCTRGLLLVTPNCSVEVSFSETSPSSPKARKG